MARYLCRAEVSAKIEIALDADLDYEAEFEGEVLSDGINMGLERCIRCPLAQHYLAGTVEIEVEAEDEEEAERIAAETIEDTKKWSAASYVAGQEVFSTYVDEVVVESLEVEEIG